MLFLTEIKEKNGLTKKQQKECKHHITFLKRVSSQKTPIKKNKNLLNNVSKLIAFIVKYFHPQYEYWRDN